LVVDLNSIYNNTIEKSIGRQPPAGAGQAVQGCQGKYDLQTRDVTLAIGVDTAGVSKA